MKNNTTPEGKREPNITKGLQAAVVVAGVVGAGYALDQQGQVNKEAIVDRNVVSLSNMDTLASVKNLQNVANNKYTLEEFNNKGYGGVNFFLRNAGGNSVMSVDVVFFQKDKTPSEVVVASQGLKTVKVTLDAATAKNKYAMEALLSGVVAKELGK